MKSSVRIIFIYALFASLWIILSDRVLTFFVHRLDSVTWFSNLKGLFFVLVTSMLLFTLIRRELRKRNAIIDELNLAAKVQQELIRELHHRIKNNLQIVISILNMETQKNDFPVEAKNRIISRILSMKSVFNIVYNVGSMKNISLRMVLDEYVRTGHRNVEINHSYDRNDLSIETIVTLLLIIDSILCSIGIPDSDVIRIDLPGDRAVDICIGAAACCPHRLNGEELSLIDLLAESINGSIFTDEMDAGKIRITYDT